MTRGSREAEFRVKGLGLKTRFVVTMTAALTLVMAIAASALYGSATRIAASVENDVVSRAVKLTLEEVLWEQVPGSKANQHKTGVEVYPVRYGNQNAEGRIYRYKDIDPETAEDRELRLLVPSGEGVGKAMRGMIFAIMAVVVLVGAGVALWVANQVSRPIQRIIEDVRLIAKGNLDHKTRSHGAGEVELLARSIDRMTRELQEAQGAQVELSIREREIQLAAGVREALLPLATPEVQGFDLGAAHLGAERFGGDFHAFIELRDGRIGLLVCDVSGTGVPAALVGATARSYLQSELERGEDVQESFARINRWLVGDVRRGMFVTSLYVLLDPTQARAQVVCAGHKVPLLRYSAADGKLRVIHPDGIALGFDKGPVFERRLKVETVQVEPGDRLLLANSAPVKIENVEGDELGEKAFYARVFRHARSQDTGAFLRALRRDLEHYAGEGGIPLDVSLVTIARLSG